MSAEDKVGFDDYVVESGASEFWELIKDAKLTLELHVEEKTSTDLILSELTRLNNDIIRMKVIKLIARREDVNMDAVMAEYQKRMSQKEEAEGTKQETYTQEEIEKAKELLRSPAILEKMVDLTARRGYVGEETNKRTLYLSFNSRRTQKSISTVVKGPSASGKSALVNSILPLFPKEDVLSYSFLTPKALVHFRGDLSHKILFIQEHSGNQAADYSIRTTISEGEISIAIPIKDEATGNFTTIEKRIPAVGLVFVETTTRERVHVENQTRLFDLYMDESKEQTERVLNAESEREDELDPGLEVEAKIWRVAQTLIENHKVYIPYRKKLVEVFPKDKIRVRRDFPRFLSLIKAHALLYQFQREKDAKERLIATKEDLEAIIPIAEVVLVQSHKEISPKLEKVLKAIEEALGVNQEFSFGELEEKCETKDRTLRRHLKELERLDLISHNGKTGKESRYMLLSPLSSMSSMSNFSSKILKVLESFEDNTESPQMSSMSPKEGSETGIEDNKDNRGQNELSSINMKDNNGLHQKELFEDTRTEGKKDGVSVHSPNSFIRTVAIGGKPVKLDYDQESGTLVVERNGKKHIVFDFEPEFQEYLKQMGL
ncbi:MAG: winged helix-turn-helix domain-containing protein [Ignavibacteriales bacterium]